MFWTRLCTLICTAFFLLSAPALAAGDFPTRTINVINAWLPGGIGEMAYRPVGDELAKILKTNVVLVPSAGAGGLMGVNKALTSRPNGYNLLLTTDASLIGLSTLRKVRWSMDDFIPVGSLGSPSVGLAIRKGDPRFSTFEGICGLCQGPSRRTERRSDGHAGYRASQFRHRLYGAGHRRKARSL